MTSSGLSDTRPPTRLWRTARFWFLALPTVTAGLAAWVPPVWVASKVRDAQLKARMYVIAAVTGVLAVIGGTLLTSAPVDATGQSPGVQDDIGFAILLIAIAVGTWTAISQRDRVLGHGEQQRGDTAEPPAVQQAMARRDARRRYQGLAADDPVVNRPGFSGGSVLWFWACSMS